METPELLTICAIALLAVFIVLAFLAAVMRGLLIVFPASAAPDGSIEPAMLTAINAGIQAAYPGSKTLHVEELK